VANLNRIILIGRLASDVELRQAGEIALAKFRLAVNPAQTLSFERSSTAQTDFFDIVAWRRLADACSKRLKNGSLVLVEGSVQIRTFEDQVGQKRWVTEVIASEVTLLDGSKAQGPVAKETVDDSDLVSDLPF